MYKKKLSFKMSRCCFWSVRRRPLPCVEQTRKTESEQTEIFGFLIHILRKAMCSSSIWTTAETKAGTRSSARRSWSYIFTFFSFLFSFYWGEIFTIVFHSSLRNEYFCSLEFMGNAVNRLEICVWNENPMRTSKIELEEKKRRGRGGEEEIKQHRG